MEALSLHTGAPTVHWEYNTSCIYVIEVKRVTPRVNQIYTPAYFLHDCFDNGILVPKYEKLGVMPEDVCTEPCLGKIISWITKWMTGFRLYPSRDK